jgi:hypothetical protein
MARQALLDAPAPEHVDEAERAVRERGAVAKKKLVKVRLSRSGESALLAALEQRGLERTAGGARVPLAEQLERALSDRGALAISGLAKILAGCSAKEARSAAYAAARAGTAALLKDGKREVLAPLEQALDAAAVGRLEASARDLKNALRALEALLRGRNATKTRPAYGIAKSEAARVGAQLAAASGQRPSLPMTRSSAPPPGPDARARVIAAVRSLVRGGPPLVFVPDVVKALRHELGTPAVHDALRQAAAEGAIELRPESGLDRLSEAERLACLVGPSGRLVSYVRLRSASPGGAR